MKTIALLIAFSLLLLFTGLFLTVPGGASTLSPDQGQPMEDASLSHQSFAKQQEPTIASKSAAPKLPVPEPSPTALAFVNGSFCEFSRLVNQGGVNLLEERTAPFLAQAMNLGSEATALFAHDGPLYSKSNRSFDSKALQLVWAMRLLGMNSSFPAPEGIAPEDREKMGRKILNDLETADSRNAIFPLIHLQLRITKGETVDSEIIDRLLVADHLDHYLLPILQELRRSGLGDPKAYYASLFLVGVEYSFSLPSAYSPFLKEVREKRPEDLRNLAQQMKRSGDFSSRPAAQSGYLAFAYDFGAALEDSMGETAKYSWTKDQELGYEPPQPRYDSAMSDCGEESYREAARSMGQWL